MATVTIGRKIGHLLVFTFFALFAIAIIIPFIWMILTGLKTNRELFLAPWRMPNKFMFANYLQAWNEGIGNYFTNSVIVTLFSTIFSTMLSCLASYPLARMQFKFRKLWILIILGGLMLAPQASLISLYRMMRVLHLFNTHLGLILVNSVFRIPFSTFLIMSYFGTIDKSMEESAYMDGATTLTVFWKIIMPLSKPILASAFIICIRAVWNDLMFALVLIQSDKLKTIPVGLMNMKGFTTTNWTVLVAGLMLASLPLIVAFIAMQRQFVRGLTEGSVKG